MSEPLNDHPQPPEPPQGDTTEDSTGTEESWSQTTGPASESPENTTAPAQSPPRVEEPAWKQTLRERFEAWLSAVERRGNASTEGPETSTASSSPDLYSIFEEIAAIRAEHRRVNRRISDTFSEWHGKLDGMTESLGQMEEQVEAISENFSGEEAPVTRPLALVLVEMYDRLQRIGEAFEKPPSQPAWREVLDRLQDSPWRATWNRQKEAFDILQDHYQELLEQAGIHRVDVVGETFDPESMTAIDTDNQTEAPAQTVTQEVRAGFSFQGELLRTAQVIVSK